MSVKASDILDAYRGIRFLRGYLRRRKVNYEKLREAEKAAEAEGRELGPDDVAPFIEDADDAVDRM